jgi:peptidoglycan-N-acetylmuramic acid deacetylase
MFLIINNKKLLMALAYCLLLAIATGFVIRQGVIVAASSSSTKSVGWGLVYGESGLQSRGEATAADLKKYDAYYIGGADEKVIYLTFDAGYEKGYTPALLDSLNKHNVPAAFFVTGFFIENNPELVRRMVDEGHIVGNHSMTHPNMTKFTDIESFRKEIEPVDALYKGIIGQDMLKYYRPPEGEYSIRNLELAKELGYTTVFWSLTYKDWNINNQPSQYEGLKMLTAHIHPGAVVLLHNTSSTNAKILDEVLTRWKADGYVFASIDMLRNDTPHG